jgi:hypothetical protein
MVRRRASIGLGLLAAVLAASGGATGCAEDAVSLAILCTALPQESDGACGVEPDLDSCQLGSGWNLTHGASYVIDVVLQSGLAERESDIPVRAETNDMQVTDVVVTLRTPGGKKLQFNGFPNPYTVKANGFIPAGGLGVAEVELIPAKYRKQLLGFYEAKDPLVQVVASLEVHARTHGQEEVVVAPWEWVVNLYAQSINPADGRCEIPPADEIICGDSAYFLCDCGFNDKAPAICAAAQ